MNLKELRISLGLSQTEFWGRIGVSQTSGSRYESYRELPEPITILIDMAYNFTLDQAIDHLKIIRGVRQETVRNGPSCHCNP